jgi:metallo-beta-lactamase family protein
MIKISFLGAAGYVTGCKKMLQFDKTKMLVDCGLLQDFKNLRERHRVPPAFAPRSLDAVALTHANIDHSVYCPVFPMRGLGALFSVR